MNPAHSEADQLRETVTRLFEEARRSGGAPYEPDRFLAYLTVPPAKKGRRVADTFAGRRRLVRFMESVQVALGICFTMDEWDRGYGLDEFVDLVAAKAAKPGPALRLAEQRLREARSHRVSEPLKFGLLTAPLIAGAVAASSLLLKAVLASLWLAIAGGVALLARHQYRYAQKLVDRIAHEAV